MTTTRMHAAEANDQLTKALVAAAARGIRPRCDDYETSYLWLSEDEQERKQATHLCTACSVLAECDAVGRHQRFGVFGGRDTTVRPGRKREAA
jgi:transcription factor WhiB